MSVSPDLATPLGTFSLTVPVASFQISSHETLLVIRHVVHFLTARTAPRDPEGRDEELVRHDPGSDDEVAAGGVMEQDVIKINNADKMRFLLDGRFDPTFGENIAILNIYNGVSGIRIQDFEGDQDEPRFAAEKVTPLPTPPGMTAPSARRPPRWPTPSIACKTLDSDGTVLCTATIAGSTGSFTYQWFDTGTPIGTGNPLTTTLAVDDHLITATATGSDGTLVASSAVPFPIAGGQASTTPPVTTTTADIPIGRNVRRVTAA